jgi:hypothetical protein
MSNADDENRELSTDELNTVSGADVSTRLQMSMDRRSKFFESLGNVMKKIDSTDSQIVQNIK